MFKFKINEIPKGVSRDQVSLKDGDFDFNGNRVRGMVFDLQFDRREAGIQIGFEFRGDIELTCDRSLEPFWHPVGGEYAVLFKEGAGFDTEDEKMSVHRLDISANTLNIETEVRDSVLLSIPLRKIHPRFFDKNGELMELEYESDSQQQMDPRWESLKTIRDNISNN